MSPRFAPGPRPGRRSAAATARATLALLLATGWLLAAALPASAVAAWGVLDPAAGSAVRDKATIRAFTDSTPGETIDGMEVQLRRDGGVPAVRVMDYASGDRQNPGRTLWTAPLNPYASWAAPGGGALANGRYRVDVRVLYSSVSFSRRPTAWAGHEFILDAPPPATEVAGSVLDVATRTIEVTWTAVPLPDFQRYVVQRAAPDGHFADLADIPNPATTRFVDSVPNDGDWRYRVVVYRAGADGSPRSTASAPATVAVRQPAEPPPPGTDPPDPGQPGQPGEQPSPPAGEPTQPAQPAPGGEPTEGPTPQPTGTPTEAPEGEQGGGGTGRTYRLSPGGYVPPPISARSVLPQVRSTPPPPSAASSASAPVAAPDPGYEEFLDYDVEREFEERHLVWQRDPFSSFETGTLTVFDRELNSEQILIPVATGLMMMVVSGHLLRLARARDRD